MTFERVFENPSGRRDLNPGSQVPQTCTLTELGHVPLPTGNPAGGPTLAQLGHHPEMRTAPGGRIVRPEPGFRKRSPGAVIIRQPAAGPKQRATDRMNARSPRGGKEDHRFYSEP